MHASEYLDVSKNHVLQFFLTTTNKKKNFLPTFVDIAKVTAHEKNSKKGDSWIKTPRRFR